MEANGSLAPREPRQQGPLQIDLFSPIFVAHVSISWDGRRRKHPSQHKAPARYRSSLLINRQMLTLHLLSEGAFVTGTLYVKSLGTSREASLEDTEVDKVAPTPLGHTGSHPEPYLCLELPWRYTAFGLAVRSYLDEQNLLHLVPISWRES